MASTLGSEFARVNKPREIEEFLDTFLIRPMGYVLMLVLRRTSVTPDVVSVVSVVAAAGAAAFYLRQDLMGAVGGLAFMLLMSALDSADGQLARATGRTSEFGRLLDGVCDNVSFLLMYVAICLAFVRNGGNPLFGLALAALGGYSHSLQSALVEFERQLFVHYCFGKGGIEKERPELLSRKLEDLRAHGAGPLRRAMVWLHFDYSRKQRQFLRSSDRLERAYGSAVETRGGVRETFAARYRRANEVLVGRWALMASNSHKLGIVLAAFVPVVFASGPLHRLGMATYFVYDLALNVPLVLLILAQRRTDRALLRDLDP